MKFNEKTAIITGGGGNIGRHVALHLAREGAKIAVVDFVRESAEETVRLVSEFGTKAAAYVCDVRDYASVHAAFESIERELGRVDILVTAAGGSTRSHMTTLARQSPEVIVDNIGVNLFGAIWFAKDTAASFEAAEKAGRIVFVTSILGIQGREECTEYSAGKAGLIALSKSLAKELGHLGATVNCVSPGLVNRPGDNSDVRGTNYLGKYCTADDIANAVDFLLSDSAGFVTGHNLIVDGGRSLGLKGVK